jgi:hypothetical protein
MSEEEPVDAREWAVAKVVETPEEAVVVAGFLHGSGIPAEVESLHVSELPVDVGGLGEVRVRVPAEQLEAALAAIAVREQGTPLGESEDLTEESQRDTDAG